MPWHVLYAGGQLKELLDLRVFEIKPCFAELLFGSIIRLFPAPDRRQTSEAVQRRRVESENLAHFSNSGAVPVRDHVGGHSRTALAVSLVNVLNDTFSFGAGRQINIDIGPLAPFFAQESFKEKPHANRIDSRDAQGITDGAIGGAPSSLRQDSLFAAKIDQIPNDKKIPGQVQFLDDP